MTDQEIIINKNIAKDIGVSDASVLSYIYHWCLHNKKHNSVSNFKDGSYWVFDTAEDISIKLKFLSKDQVQKAVKRLCDRKLVTAAWHNNRNWIKIRWYTISPAGMSYIRGMSEDFKESVHEESVEEIMSAESMTGCDIPEEIPHGKERRKLYKSTRQQNCCDQNSKSAVSLKTINNNNYNNLKQSSSFHSELCCGEVEKQTADDFFRTEHEWAYQQDFLSDEEFNYLCSECSENMRLPQELFEKWFTRPENDSLANNEEISETQKESVTEYNDMDYTTPQCSAAEPDSKPAVSYPYSEPERNDEYADEVVDNFDCLFTGEQPIFKKNGKSRWNPLTGDFDKDIGEDIERTETRTEPPAEEPFDPMRQIEQIKKRFSSPQRKAEVQTEKPEETPRIWAGHTSKPDFRKEADKYAWGNDEAKEYFIRSSEAEYDRMCRSKKAMCINASFDRPDLKPKEITDMVWRL